MRKVGKRKRKENQKLWKQKQETARKSERSQQEIMINERIDKRQYQAKR